MNESFIHIIRKIDIHVNSLAQQEKILTNTGIIV